MGKKRKRKPASPQDKDQDNKINSEESEEKQVDAPEDTENNDDTSEGSEEEKRISRRQKIAEIDRSLAKTLEARDAGKKKDLRDPVTKFFQETGKAAVQYKNTISIVLMILIVVLFLIAYNVVTSSDVKVTEWSNLSATNKLDELQQLAQSSAGREIEPEVYRKLYYAFKKDTSRKLVDRLKGQIDLSEKILDKFDKNDDYADLCNLVRIELPALKKDLEFLKKRNETIEKSVEIPEGSTVVLPSDSVEPLEVAMVTDFGTIKLELFDKICPNAVSAFMFLVQEGFYQEDGLGGSIKRAKTSNSIERLVIGEMPAVDYQNQSKTYEQLKNIDDRVKKLATKWQKPFDERADGLGWTLPLEPAGLKLDCEKGVLVAWLDNETNPESASYKFSILLDADKELTGSYMVIGSVKRVYEKDVKIENKQQIMPELKLDADSFKVASQVGADGIKISYTLVLKTKAERVYTQLFTKNEEEYVPVESMRYYIKRNNREFVADSPENADYIIATPGMYTFIAKDTYYKNDKDEIVKADKDIYTPVFPEDADAKATKELPVYSDAINENGELLGQSYLPNVLYKDLPIEIKVRKKKPEKVDKFVFTNDKDSPLYFEEDINSPNSNRTPPMPPNPNPNGINFGGPGGGTTTIPIR